MNENIQALARQDATYIEALELVLSLAAAANSLETGDDKAAGKEAISIVKARLEQDFPSS